MVKYYAGIDLGGTFIKCGIANDSGKLIIRDKIATLGDYTAVMKLMAQTVVRLAEAAKVRVSGIGIGCPGIIDGKTGVVAYNNNLGWVNVPLGKDIAKITGIPTRITNDANAAALGEAAFGAGKHCDDMIFITLGTGVGGGIILNGQLFEGNNGAGAELGHMVIKGNGERCTCGRRGCLEAYASTGALVRQAQTYMKKHKDTLLWALCEGNIDNMNGKIVFEGIDAKDEGAEKVFRKYAHYLACGLTNIANIFRPKLIVLGGGTSAQGKKLTIPLQRRLSREIYGGQKHAPVKIVTATLGNDAGIWGGIKLAQENDKTVDE